MDREYKEIPNDMAATSEFVSEAQANDMSDHRYKRIDHIAIAVIDLEEAVRFYSETLGFELLNRREIRGKKSGMKSAEMGLNGIVFVLCQGTEPESQVSRLIEHHGPCVAHIAIEVENIDSQVEALRGNGLKFDTSVIRGSGLSQAFSSRCQNSGLTFEFIERNGEANFLEENVQSLFDQLEEADAY